MTNSECTRSYNVVKALEALATDFKKLSSLGPSDLRLSTVLDAIRFGVDETYDADELRILERLGVPRALYTKPVS